MLSNVRVFLRILQRQKLFSVINLLGITVSMTSAVLIYLYTSPWIFIGTGTATVVIALCITLYHSLKAALTNPVDVLRDE